MLSKRNIFIGLISVVVLFVLAEFTLLLPAFNPNNPPVTSEVAWSSSEAEAIFNQACADCHSNETVYPWYSYVVPVAWLVNHDVQEGREKFNISTGLMPDDRQELKDMILEAEMPPAPYVVMHPEAALDFYQKMTLIDGMEDSLNFSGRESGESDDDDEREEDRRDEADDDD
jgi:hypothetical protein